MKNEKKNEKFIKISIRRDKFGDFSQRTRACLSVDGRKTQQKKVVELLINI